MKKQFFYAAMAVALMASCTSEDNLAVDPVNPTPEEDKVAIELGIDSPTLNAEVGGRSTGSVGDVDGAANTWASQQLYIAMFDKDGNLVKDGDNNLLAWDTYEYRAPKAGASGDIRIYVKDTYEKPLTDQEAADVEEKGQLKYVYYPVSYAYDFYGWHLDGAENDGYDNFEETKQIENIVITGSQDIMGARTKEFTYENYVTNTGLSNEITEGEFGLLQGWDFSARTARNGIKPILKFEHQLARLKFFVRAGSKKTALYDNDASANRKPMAYTDGTLISYTGENGAIDHPDGKTDADIDPMSTLAMYVTGITAQNMSTTFTMNLNDNGKVTTTEATTPTYGNFVLGSKQANGEIGDLTAVAPEYLWVNKDASYPNETAENQYYGTPVGESIIFFPSANKNASPAEGTTATKTTEEIALKLDLKQFVVNTEDERDETKTYQYKKQSGKVIVKASQLVGGITEFKAGYSYNVYITIYGFERIEVSAELTPWSFGGDVDVDIEDDAEGNTNNGGTNEGEEDDDEPQTPATYTTTIAVAYDDQATGVTPVVKINDEETTTITGTTGTSFTYEVAADGYQTETGTSTIGDADATENILLKKLYDAVINVTNATGTVEVKVNGEVISETDGNYTFKAVNGGSYLYTVTATPAEGEPVVKTGTIVFSSESATTTIDMAAE